MGIDETEWRTCGDRYRMRSWMNQARAKARRWTLFNLACAERVRDLLDGKSALVGLLDDVYDHTATFDGPFIPSPILRLAVSEAVRQMWAHRDPLRKAAVAAARAVRAVHELTLETSEMVAVAIRRRDLGKAYDIEKRIHCDFIRDIFGTPFHPVVLDPAWRTDTALSLSRVMYETRVFTGMPILADALQDAGCESADILDHCRDPNGTHVRGCWVVDLLLGKV